ncbi:MAG: hypothetical protein ACYDCL_22385 [Myxococcales bacterium]
MRASLLLWAVCGLACAARNPQSPLPPTVEQAPPSAGPSDEPYAFGKLRPHTEDLRSVPRIGAIHGRIVAIEGDKLAIAGRALAGDRADLSMFVGPVTEVTIDGRPARPTELRPGMDVRASYTEDRATVIADRVEARTGVPAPAK